MSAEVSPDGRLIAFDLLCGRLNDAATLNEVATGLRKRQALLAGESWGGAGSASARPSAADTDGD
jgi:hypothetical protein